MRTAEEKNYALHTHKSRRSIDSPTCAIRRRHVMENEDERERTLNVTRVLFVVPHASAVDVAVAAVVVGALEPQFRRSQLCVGFCRAQNCLCIEHCVDYMQYVCIWTSIMFP